MAMSPFVLHASQDSGAMNSIMETLTNNCDEQKIAYLSCRFLESVFTSNEPSYEGEENVCK